MNKSLIHGENGFKPVDKLPKGVVSKHKIFIAGHSETGHHHVLESKVEFEVIEVDRKQLEKELYVRLFEPAQVVHKKSFDIHETKTLQPGIYQITHKTEYDPFQQIIRQVWD